MTEKSKSKIQKSRAWAFVMYPDSAPENWRDILSEAVVDTLVSPLHDRDTNPDGEIKKPHWHVVLSFPGPTTMGRAQKVADSVNASHVQTINSLRSYGRYLCHLDNPEKMQYEKSDVLSLGGIDYLELIQSAADIDSCLSDMEEWCDTNHVFSYAALCRYARKEKPEWARLLRHRCTVHMKAYLQSCQWEIEKGVSYDFLSSDEHQTDE